MESEFREVSIEDEMLSEIHVSLAVNSNGDVTIKDEA